MSLFSFLNNTINTVLVGSPAVSQQPAPSANMPPVAESQAASHAASNPDRNSNGSQIWTTRSPSDSSAAGQTAPSTAPQQSSQTVAQGWAGQAAPPVDTGGVKFDFSQEALDAAGVTLTAGSSATAPTGPATSPATGKSSGDTALSEQPVSVTGKTMVRVESDEDRLRAWAVGMLQQERRTALPLSLVTDATATPAAQSGGATLNNANTDLSARPARTLERV